MKKKIYAHLLLIAAAVLVLALTLSMALYQRALSDQAEQDVAQAAAIISASFEDSGDTQTLRDCAATGLRVTLIDPDGTVLFESDSSNPMENHLSRPEIAEALRTGTGTDTRTSQTLGYSTYYCARLLTDGSVLRVALHTAGIRARFFQLLPFVAAIALLIGVLAHFLARALTKAIITPIEEMGQDLGNIAPERLYPELRPFAENVKRQQEIRQEAEAMRRDFTANVSHELKTPLTSISGYAEMIEAGIARPEDIPDFATRIHKEATRLLQLIGDIIALSRLDTLTAQDDFAPVDLKEIAESTEELLGQNAAKAKVSLCVQGEHLYVYGSRDELEELCYNLCDNAIRYNRPGGIVELRTARSPSGGTNLIVSDTGIGIPKGQEERIFERFYRVDKGRSRKLGGTGLGLAIVKHIAIHHKADIRVASVLGEGTEITVRFPPVSDAESTLSQP